MKNSEISRVARRYLPRTLFIKFLQINNNIPYSLAVQKKFVFSMKFLCANQLKIKHFELPPPPPRRLQNETYENKIDLDAHLRSHINRWLLLLSIVLQNIQFRSDFGLGHCFDTPCIHRNNTRSISAQFIPSTSAKFVIRVQNV